MRDFRHPTGLRIEIWGSPPCGAESRNVRGELREMNHPPDYSFHQCLKGNACFQREGYAGRYDLDRLPFPDSRRLLQRVQGILNLSLMSELAVPEHKEHHPFHVDFIDSAVTNALAFTDGEYSFIGLTMPLVETILDVSARLSNSAAAALAVGFQLSGEESYRLQALLFEMMLVFIVAHEYTHHVHGHLSLSEGDSGSLRQTLEDGDLGSIEEQIREIGADSYAAYHLMGNWLGGVRRSEATNLLRIDGLEAGKQDEAIFSSIVTAVGGFMLLRPVRKLDSNTIYKLQHPPTGARLNFFMQTAVAWCEPNRVSLKTWMTNERFLGLLAHVAEVVWEPEDERYKDWSAQTAFLRSGDGAAYLQKLKAGLDAYKAVL